MLEAGKPSIKTDDIQQVSTIPEKKKLKNKDTAGHAGIWRKGRNRTAVATTLLTRATRCLILRHFQ
jgi:hypothetical protein